MCLISGCSIMDASVDKAASANDKAIDSAIFGLCYGFSVGSIKRKFNTPQLIKLYNDLCDLNDDKPRLIIE